MTDRDEFSKPRRLIGFIKSKPDVCANLLLSVATLFLATVTARQVHLTAKSLDRGQKTLEQTEETLANLNEQLELERKKVDLQAKRLELEAEEQVTRAHGIERQTAMDARVHERFNKIEYRVGEIFELVDELLVQEPLVVKIDFEGRPREPHPGQTEFAIEDLTLVDFVSMTVFNGGRADLLVSVEVFFDKASGARIGPCVVEGDEETMILQRDRRSFLVDASECFRRASQVMDGPASASVEISFQKVD